MPSTPHFPSVGTGPSDLAVAPFIRYPEDVWTDAAVVTQFDDQMSIEVQSTASTGYWGNLHVIVQAYEADADKIFAFLVAQRLTAIPFWFTHRKRGEVFVRYWPGTNPPTLPYKRNVAGSVQDLVEFDLPLRQEAGV